MDVCGFVCTWLIVLCILSSVYILASPPVRNVECVCAFKLTLAGFLLSVHVRWREAFNVRCHREEAHSQTRYDAECVQCNCTKRQRTPCALPNAVNVDRGHVHNLHAPSSSACSTLLTTNVRRAQRTDKPTHTHTFRVPPPLPSPVVVPHPPPPSRHFHNHVAHGCPKSVCPLP